MDDTCRGCAADAECASLTCLPDGACADAGTVLYAAPDGSAAANCRTTAKCSLLRAVALIDGTKSTIRLDPGLYLLPGTLALPFSVHLVGRDAVLERAGSGTGETLLVGVDADIVLDYLSVRGADGDAVGHGIGCHEATLTAREVTIEGNAAGGLWSDQCAVAISHSRIASNRGVGLDVAGGSVTMTRSTMTANQGGAIRIVGRTDYDLENNLIVKNGDAALGFGGLWIMSIAMDGNRVFEFNTVAFNQAAGGVPPGVECDFVMTPLVFSNNIVFGNVSASTANQVDGANCTWRYSDIGPVAVAGPGNLAADPEFADLMHGDYHLMATSPLRDAADPAATQAVDLDGDSRPEGAAPDIGADEIK